MAEVQPEYEEERLGTGIEQQLARFEGEWMYSTVFVLTVTDGSVVVVAPITDLRNSVSHA